MLNRIFYFVFIAAIFANAQSVLINPIIADLKVGEKQVSGEAKGLLNDEENLKKAAIANAIKNGADVLVDVSFFREEDDDSLLIKAVGFPAYYTNFRLESQRLNGIIGKSFYFSARYQYAIARNLAAYWNKYSETFNYDTSFFHYKGGAIFEIGGSIGVFFISGDLSGGEKFFGGGASLGVQIKPAEKFQTVFGYSGGFWAFWVPTGYENYSPYSAVNGPFAKLLFGKDNFWVEINYRFLFTSSHDEFVVNQISVGFTYIKTKNKYRR
ncbi:MAG: hypothetical protein FWF51_08485 [Chitinivibrionia bacterium]|nr:hypothetical protein [Chitinivibrionia bacterium]